MMKPQQLLDTIAGQCVAVIGDICLEEFITGKMAGIADEGPIPVVQRETSTIQAGAAGHVAILLNNTGLEVHLAGILGQDQEAEELEKYFQSRGISCEGLLPDEHSVTSRRAHVIVAGDHFEEREVIRILTKEKILFTEAHLKHITNFLENLTRECRAIVVVDKDGNFITYELIKAVRDFAARRNLLLIGDSEKQLSLFTDFTAITPNETEARDTAGADDEWEDMGERLRDELNCKYVFMSRGSEGISVFEEAKKPLHLPTETFQVFDVAGAGEAVVAAVTAGLIAGGSAEETAQLANLTAGAAIARPGLVQVTRDEIIALARRKTAHIEAEKLVTFDRLKKIMAGAQKQGKRVVWTNGCFDILHVGHILYLEKARSLGDMLVIGLNSDASVRKFKEPSRPIVEESQRAKLLSALSCVDYITIFDESSPLELLQQLQPDVYAKGGDYSLDTLDQRERRAIESYGGRIALLPGIEGMSTSDLIDKILKTYK